MPRYAFRLDYHGGPFQGWQRQASGPTVQAAVEGALSRLNPDPVTIHAAGRTDTGVHATGQVIHADLARDWDPFRLMGALNHHLRPDPVAATACAPVPDDFHARFSATQRRYLYRILCRPAPPVHQAGLVWARHLPLALDPMREAAAHLLGHHDFTTFRASLCQALSPVKTLDALDIDGAQTDAGYEIRLTLRARSFLHNQVRSIVGTLERVGAGAWEPDRVAQALAARDRAACGPVAPPTGLYLTGVGYPVDPFASRT
jgi:tRNA pseudouridine38-40 synthase